MQSTNEDGAYTYASLPWTRKKLVVIILTYNQEAFVAETLQSVIDQETNFEFDIFVSDDGSTDKTFSIIKEFTKKYPHIQVFQNEKNVGVALNYTQLLCKCDAEYIANLDGDDLMLPGKLQKQIDFLDAHPEYAMCFHNVKWLYTTGRLVSGKNPWKKSSVSVNDMLSRAGNFIANSSKVYRKSAIPKEGFDTSIKIINDFLWHMQNIPAGLIGYLNEELGIYRPYVGMLSAMKKDKDKILVSIDDRLKALQLGLKHGGSRLAFWMGVLHVWGSSCCAFFSIQKYREALKSSWYIFHKIRS